MWSKIYANALKTKLNIFLYKTVNKSRFLAFIFRRAKMRFKYVVSLLLGEKWQKLALITLCTKLKQH